MKKPILLGVLALLGLAAPAAAQGGAIRAGMSPDEVRAAFGAPARMRTEGDWTYWFYANGCPVRCGSDDVVFLQNDHVVAAVLRTGVRRFEGPPAPNALASIEGLPPTESGVLRLPAHRASRAAATHRRTNTTTRSAAARTTATRRSSAARTTGDGPVRMRVIHTNPPAASSAANGPRQGSAGAASTVTGTRRQGSAPQNGRTTIVGAPNEIVGTGGAGSATVDGVTVTPGRRGSRSVAGDSAGLRVRTTSDSSVDQARLDREKRVTPRVMPTPAPGIHP
jgi:hypothetical protein